MVESGVVGYWVSGVCCSGLGGLVGGGGSVGNMSILGVEIMIYYSASQQMMLPCDTFDTM